MTITIIISVDLTFTGLYIISSPKLNTNYKVNVGFIRFKENVLIIVHQVNETKAHKGMCTHSFPIILYWKLFVNFLLDVSENIEAGRVIL